MLDENLRPLAERGRGSQPAILCGLPARRMHSAVAEAIQPVGSLSLDDRMGDAPVLQSARRDLRSASHGSGADQLPCIARAPLLASVFITGTATFCS